MMGVWMVVVIVLTICTTIIIPNCYHVCGPKSLSLIIPVLQSSDNYSHFPDEETVDRD